MRLVLLLVLAAVSLVCGGQATKMGSKQRLRRELRSLSTQERQRVFAAMHVLKTVPTDKGQAIYGVDYLAYDDFVAKHFRAAAFPGCDQAHLGSGFATFHRAFTLEFENALLAVDPEIQALPYWDYNIDARLPSGPRSSVVWEWFGSSEGDSKNQYEVRDGLFANWTVASGSRALRLLDQGSGGNSTDLLSPHGLLRAPWNRNPSPAITRRRTSCGSETVFKESQWDTCLSMPLYMAWYACVDPTVHTWAHSFLGGIWGEARDLPRVPCYLEHAVGIPKAWGKGCLDCPKDCNASGACNCSVSKDLRCVSDRVTLDPRMTYGDFADTWTSPNDPIFFFHHANVDRQYMTWQRRHYPNATKARSANYGFPETGVPCKGHGLDDVIASSWPFAASVAGLPTSNSSAGGPWLTNRDVVRLDGWGDTPYTYDSL